MAAKKKSASRKPTKKAGKISASCRNAFEAYVTAEAAWCEDFNAEDGGNRAAWHMSEDKEKIVHQKKAQVLSVCR